MALSAEQSTGETHTFNSIQPDEKWMPTSIMDLPMEVLIYLLNKVESYEDLKSCTMVTRAFYTAASWLLEDRHCFVFDGDEMEWERNGEIRKTKSSDCIRAVKKYGGIRESRVLLRKCSTISCKWLKRKITSGVTCLELNCCQFHWKKLATLLLRFEDLEELKIAMNLRSYNSHPPIPCSLNHLTTLMGSMEDLDWEEAKTHVYVFVAHLRYLGKEPKATLKKLNVDVMFASATSFLIMLITHLYQDKIALEELSMKIYYEEMKLLMYEKSGYYENPQGGLINIPGLAEHYAPVKCADLLRTSQATLKKLSFCCSSNFPYAGGWPTVADPDEDVYQESSLRQRLAEGLFEDLFKPGEGTQWTFPNLQVLSINIPLLLISHDTHLLKYIKQLVKSNVHIQKLTLKGLYFKEGEESLIRNIFLSSHVKCTLGLKAISVKPGNLIYFSDELEEITMDVMGDYRGNFDSLFPQTKVPTVFKNLKYFSAANGSLYMSTYGFKNLLPYFPNLTELHIRDLSQLRNGTRPIEHKRQGSALAELSDDDMQCIFQNLGCLEILHLHCNMFGITDQGLTGLKRKFCCDVLQRNISPISTKKTDKIGLSFSALKELKYLFLYYTGSGVTEITARFAFKDLYDLEYFSFDNCSLSYRDREMMYRKIMKTSPSCHIDIDTSSKIPLSQRIIRH